MTLHFSGLELFLGGLALGCLAMVVLVSAINDSGKADQISDLEDEIERLRKLIPEEQS